MESVCNVTRDPAVISCLLLFVSVTNTREKQLANIYFDSCFKKFSLFPAAVHLIATRKGAERSLLIGPPDADQPGLQK